jgi:hypothetical protein
MRRVILFLVALVGCSVLAQTGWAQAPIRATSTFHPDGTRSTTVVDPDKMTAEETLTDKKGTTLRKTTYLLDEHDQPVGSIAYDAKGTVLYRASYKRDGAGRIEEENITTSEGAFLRKRVYTYGAQNKVANVIEYDAEGRVVQKAKRGTPAAPAVPVAPAKAVRRK